MDSCLVRLTPHVLVGCFIKVYTVSRNKFTGAGRTMSGDSANVVTSLRGVKDACPRYP